MALSADSADMMRMIPQRVALRNANEYASCFGESAVSTAKSDSC